MQAIGHGIPVSVEHVQVRHKLVEFFVSIKNAKIIQKLMPHNCTENATDILFAEIKGLQEFKMAS